MTTRNELVAICEEARSSAVSPREAKYDEATESDVQRCRAEMSAVEGSLMACEIVLLQAERHPLPGGSYPLFSEKDPTGIKKAVSKITLESAIGHTPTRIEFNDGEHVVCVALVYNSAEEESSDSIVATATPLLADRHPLESVDPFAQQLMNEVLLNTLRRCDLLSSSDGDSLGFSAELFVQIGGRVYGDNCEI